MYKIRTIELKNGEMTKEVPVIEFDNPDKEIIGEFLMVESSLIADELDQAIVQIEKGEMETAEWTGNRFSLTVNRNTAIIEDLLEGMYEPELTYPPCEIKPKQLQEFFQMWQDVKRSYNQNK